APPPSGEVGPVPLQDAGLGLDRLGQRPKGRPVPIGQRPALPPGNRRRLGGVLRRGARRGTGQAVGQLGQQPALADAGGADDRDQLRPLTRAGPAGGGQQGGPLAVPGHQRAGPAGWGSPARPGGPAPARPPAAHGRPAGPAAAARRRSPARWPAGSPPTPAPSRPAPSPPAAPPRPSAPRAR